MAKYNALPEGAEKQAAMEKMKESFGGARRVWVGKDRNRDSLAALNDAQGRPRLTLRVTPEGDASIQFLDETGKVVHTVAPGKQ